MNTTTKRYPRTLSEAFPCDANNACAIHAFKRHGRDLVQALILGALIGGPALLMVLFYPNGV